METRPDVLVLGGGGIAGVAWLTGVLAGIEDSSGVSLSECDYFVGTSAGSLVAARLAAGETLGRPGLEVAAADGSPRVPAPSAFTNWALGLWGPAASVGVRLLSAPSAVARGVALRAAPADREPARRLLGGEYGWTGRLRVVAVERRRGRRVVFGSPGAPDASVADAVQASCAVPWLYAPVSIGGVDYVDGGVWSPTSLDVAPVGRETRVLCLCPTASLHGPLPLAMRAASRAATLFEATIVAGRGAKLEIVAPDATAAAAIGRDLMARAPADEILAAGYRQGLAL